MGSYEDSVYTGRTSEEAQARQFADKDIVVERLIGTLKQVLPEPPLRNQPLQAEFAETTLKRSKRKSKFTKEQDEMIVDLKSKGKSWIDIAQITGVGSFLAARNRYQVLIGQQGVGSSVWGNADSQNLQSLVDEGEIEKWRFIAREMYKLTGKSFTDVQCRELIREIFLEDPSEFGIDEESLNEFINPSTNNSKDHIDLDNHQSNPSHSQSQNENSTLNSFQIQSQNQQPENQNSNYHPHQQHYQDQHLPNNQNQSGYDNY